ncbi:MAG: SpoIIIAH-like family protein [Lachnospiraceae bacterium]
MKHLVHKNQFIITMLALLIAFGGILKFSIDTDKEKNEKNQAKETSALTYEISDEDTLAEGEIFTDTEEEIEDPGEAIQVSATAGEENFIAKAKLNREQIRAKNKETLQAILDNKTVGEGSKKDAVKALVNLTKIAEEEEAIEMLLGAKGFSSVVVSIIGDSVDIILKMDGVTDAMRAQVEDIVKRKTDVPPENIVITPLRSEKYEKKKKD